MSEFELETEETRKGNPIAKFRFKWQTYSKDTDEPYESEWEQFKKDALIHAAKDLIKEFNRSGKDELVVKVFNEMNHKAKPTVITLKDAYKIVNENSNN